jgi:hypothetical protein
VSARPAAGSGARPADPAEEPWGRDPRVPDWIEVALPPVIAGAPIADFAAVQLQRQSDALIPLRTLFESAVATRGGPAKPSAASPGAADEARTGRPEAGSASGAAPPDARWRAGKFDEGMLFDVQSIAVARFLAERAGPTILGDVVQGAMRGGRIDDVLRSAAGVPQNVEGLDAAWRAWLQEQQPGRRGGM